MSVFTCETHSSFKVYFCFIVVKVPSAVLCVIVVHCFTEVGHPQKEFFFFFFFFAGDRASAWFLVSKFGPPAFSEHERSSRALLTGRRGEGGGRRRRKKIVLFAVLPCVFVFMKTARAPQAPGTLLLPSFLACEGGGG